MIYGTPYSDEEIRRAVELLGELGSVSDAARSLGRSAEGLRKVFRRLGMPSPSVYCHRIGATQLMPPPVPVVGTTVPDVGTTVPAVAPPVVAEAPITGAPPQLGQTRDPTPEWIRTLVDYCRAHPRSLEDVCNRVGCSPQDARQLVERAKRAGYTLEIQGSELSWQRPEQTHDEVREDWPTPVVGGRYMLGVISDLHLGSKYCMRQQLQDFINHAYEVGVRTIAIPGDLLDGCYEHGRWELSHHGWDDQAADAYETLPRHDGLRYYAIDGNHDETFWSRTGMLSGQRLAELFASRGRDDLTYLGLRQGRILLRTPSAERPIVVEMWHPRPGKSYALSYQLQKRVEGYAPGAKPDILLTGHWHTFCYIEQRGVHALACGTFQSGASAFSKSLSGTPSCGGQILSAEVTRHGTLRHVGVERTSYYLPEGGRDVEMPPTA